jgi:GTPase
MEILGYSSTSTPILASNAIGKKLTWEEISEKSSKVISFIDLAGHERYLRTTVFGLTGCAPDYVMLMVAANNGLIGMSKEHLGIAVSLGVPVMVCITKIDMTPANVLEETENQLLKILKGGGCRKTPMFIDSMDAVVLASVSSSSSTNHRENSQQQIFVPSFEYPTSPDKELIYYEYSLTFSPFTDNIYLTIPQNS